MNGVVYLLLEVDTYGEEYHKIGITKRNIQKRISELQTGNSNKISLLHYYESKNYKKIESLLHLKFSTQKTESNNEWFKLNNNDVLQFINHCNELDNLIPILNENYFLKKK